MTEGMVWGIVGVVATLIVGVPIAVFIARRYSSAVVLRRALSFERLSLLTHRLGGGLSLTFEGRHLEAVSRTYLALWHERGTSIRGSDVLAKDPLRVVVNEDDEILQVLLLSRSNPLTELGVSEVEGCHVLTFEYLDKLDGGVLEVLHTGTVAARIEGTVPGATIRKPRRAIFDASPRSGTVKPRKWWRPNDRLTRRRLMYVLMGSITSLYAVFSLVALFVVALRVPALVDESRFDLDTLDGQEQFASAVTRAGATNEVLIWTYGVALVVMALFSIYIWVSLARLGRSVPKEILSSASSDEGVDATSLDEVRQLLNAGSTGSMQTSNEEFLRAVLAEATRRRAERGGVAGVEERT